MVSFGFDDFFRVKAFKKGKIENRRRYTQHEHRQTPSTFCLGKQVSKENSKS